MSDPGAPSGSWNLMQLQFFSINVNNLGPQGHEAANKITEAIFVHDTQS